MISSKYAYVHKIRHRYGVKSYHIYIQFMKAEIPENEKKFVGSRGSGTEEVLIVCPSVVVVKITTVTNYRAFSDLETVRIVSR
jgi:hypothetical protein